jgi:diguanylate cyclase (GGDEF)-like protein
LAVTSTLTRLPERRDLDARSARDRLALMMGVHPRELRVLDSRLASVMADRMSEMNRRVQRLVDSNAIDELTGTLRRQAGLQALEREIDRARRSADGKLVVAFIDVDDLKHLNDSQGHAAGDRLLQSVATTLRTQLRSYDLVMRWGGDEFVCVLPEAGLEGAARIVEDIEVGFAARNGYGFSTGLAALEDTDTAEDLVIRADQRLYESRRERRPAPVTMAALSGAARSLVHAFRASIFRSR